MARNPDPEYPSRGSHGKIADRAWIQAWKTIEEARKAAIARHGTLKGGMRRWAHHLTEECEEAVREMWNIQRHHPEAKVALIAELAQVAQLVQTMIAMCYQNREEDEEGEVWDQKSLDANCGMGTDPTPESQS